MDVETRDDVFARRAAQLLLGSPDPVWFVGPGGAVEQANAAARALLGWGGSLPSDHATVFTPASRMLLDMEVLPRLEAGESWRGELVAVDAGRRVPLAVLLVPGEDGDGHAWFAVLASDLRPHQAQQAALERLGTHDELTGLVNRPAFLEQAEVAVRSRGGAVVLVDVDDLASVNETLGHAAGDAVLVEVATRLRSGVVSSTVVARLGGDEFALFLPGAEVTEAHRLAGELHTRLSRPTVVGGRLCRVGVSVGVAASSGGSEVHTLLRQADVALYLARTHGGGRVEVHTPEDHQRVSDLLRLRTDVREALDRGEFRLEYQPIVWLDTGLVRGVEALLRWDHPDLGPIGPDAFVPLLEASGDILDVGRWVLHESLRQLAAWDELGPAAATWTVSVNVAVAQLRPQLEEEVRSALVGAGVAPGRLTLEITETGMVDDTVSTGELLQRLRQAGVRVALDDFGTGFATLDSLRRLPVDQLKIDRSFTAALDDVGADALVSGICRMAAALGLTVVAEGIEHVGQVEHLRRLACDFGQGYLWSRPVRPERLSEVAAALPTV
ncbi:putative bifunctional diguanylate cyclase/phosphodiesterase [Egicoccus halophilus]|uniref:Diguanylate cyclase (GGDEF) domain-containing protein n=1 Tax=Egicoccus halophilus TaxID=1670830 RepID=A0A8J3EW65_9ACTN|nr:bifunctional diguanylate cyclase/phosphodiesterase [Egicoccus halophilus]GGI02781.1 hypothetical protein GCM10011354_01520 [Egicoccus halophilus]